MKKTIAIIQTIARKMCWPCPSGTISNKAVTPARNDAIVENMLQRKWETCGQFCGFGVSGSILGADVPSSGLVKVGNAVRRVEVINGDM